MNELYHHGVKGMKWGVRKAQKYSEDGSKRTTKKLNKFLDMDKKYGHDRSVSEDRKVTKAYQKYDKSAAKDVRKLTKINEIAKAKEINSGRTYIRSMMDPAFMRQMLTDAAASSNVKIGEKFTSNVTRNSEFGGVTVTVNGTANNYSTLKGIDRRLYG